MPIMHAIILLSPPSKNPDAPPAALLARTEVSDNEDCSLSVKVASVDAAIGAMRPDGAAAAAAATSAGLWLRTGGGCMKCGNVGAGVAGGCIFTSPQPGRLSYPGGIGSAFCKALFLAASVTDCTVVWISVA